MKLFIEMAYRNVNLFYMPRKMVQEYNYLQNV